MQMKVAVYKYIHLEWVGFTHSPALWIAKLVISI